LPFDGSVAPKSDDQVEYLDLAVGRGTPRRSEGATARIAAWSIAYETYGPRDAP
jgi:hypothetical protein